MTRISNLLGPVVLCLSAALPCLVHGEDAPAKYTLRYVFQPGQTLRWDVTHRTSVRTAMTESALNSETYSSSVKLWRVKEVRPDETAIFEHRVEDVVMRQKLGRCEETCYNSRTDKTPPPGFEQVARSLGVPLAVVTMDSRGKIIKRDRPAAKDSSNSPDLQLTIPLPEEPIPIGHSWSLPSERDVTAQGVYKRVKLLQKFTLESVKTGVATIKVETQILTPIQDPALEAQLIQCGSRGTIRFDIDAGRVLEQQMDLDKRVVGFRGEASSVHYLTRFTEKLRLESTVVAERAKVAK